MSYLWLKRGSSICGAMEAGLVLDIFVLLLLRGSKFFFWCWCFCCFAADIKGESVCCAANFFSALVSDLFPVCVGVKF